MKLKLWLIVAALLAAVVVCVLRLTYPPAAPMAAFVCGAIVGTILSCSDHRRTASTT